MSSRLSTAAALPSLHGLTHITWLVLAVVVQFVWGLYSVCTRYLQTRAPVPIPTLQLSAIVSITCWPGLLIFCMIPSYLWNCYQQRLNAQKAAAAASTEGDNQQKGCIALDALKRTKCSSSSSSSTLAGSDSMKSTESDSQAGTTPQPSRRVRFLKWLKIEALALFVGSLICLSALGMVYASLFVPAYLVQLVFMSTPLITAVANKLVLKQPTPYMLWPALTISIIGSALVVIGQWMENSTHTGSAFAAVGYAAKFSATTNLMIGVAISLASALIFCAYFLFLQTTRHLVSGEKQLLASRNIAIIMLVPLALGIEGTNWSWLWHLTAVDWGVLIFAGIGVYTLANIGLQWCTRTLGATVMTQLNCMRLVSSIVGSVVLMSEVPRHYLIWIGFVIVIMSMGGWLYLLAAKSKQGAKKTEAAAPCAASPEAAADVEQPAVAAAEGVHVRELPHVVSKATPCCGAVLVAFEESVHYAQVLPSFKNTLIETAQQKQ